MCVCCVVANVYLGTGVEVVFILILLGVLGPS